MEGILVIIALLVFIFLFYMLVIGGISKLFNVSIGSRYSSTKITPDDVDNVIKEVKGNTSKVLQKIKSYSFKSHKTLTGDSSKIEKLSELSKLFEKGHISEKEFELLKNELLEKKVL